MTSFIADDPKSTNFKNYTEDEVLDFIKEFGRSDEFDTKMINYFEGNSLIKSVNNIVKNVLVYETIRNISTVQCFSS
jgi:hypothetical protein